MRSALPLVTLATLGASLGVLLAACAGTPAPSASPSPVPADTVRVDGSPGVLPLVRALAEEYRAQHPGAVVLFGEGLGSQARIEALAAGRIDVAMASHGVDATALAARGLAVHEIAKAAVVFGVHRSVPLRGLASRQLCDVYAGRATDWRQLGGPALPVAARTRPADEVDAEVVLAGVACLRGAALDAVATVVQRPEEMAAALAETPGAIGMTSLPFVERSDGRVRALALDGVEPTADNVRGGAYPLTRRSMLLTHAPPPPAVARFLAFVRGPAGTRVIVANGAVPAE